MRMKLSRIQPITIKRRITTKDGEGVPIVSYDESKTAKAEIWPAGGALQVQTYGDRAHDMQNVKLEGEYKIIDEDGHTAYQFKDFTVSEGDGMCIYNRNDEPDYKIISITPYKPLKLEVERI